MHVIYGLVDPRNMHVFHVGCTSDQKPKLDHLPIPVADRLKEIEPASPQMVILQEVETHPLISWVKWSKRFSRDILTKDWMNYEWIAKLFSNPTRTRRALGEKIPADAEKVESFREFDRQNPEVCEELTRMALNFFDQGGKVPGMDVLVGLLRSEGPQTVHHNQYKISNDHKAFYARKLQMIEPRLLGQFAISESVADDLVLEDGRTWVEFAQEHWDALRFADPIDGEEEDIQWTY